MSPSVTGYVLCPQDGTGDWENVPTGQTPALMIPDINPQITGTDGQYQWDVLSGSYRVHVEAINYYPTNSSVVSIPPPVNDLHVGLLPIIIVDSIPPTTTKTIGDPIYGSFNEWLTSNSEINLTAIDDNSGVDATYYRIWHNNGWTDWIEYSGNFSLSGEGLHYLEYYSVDNAGNVEETHNQTHYVDDTPPSITIETPSPWNALQDGVILQSIVTDTGGCGVAWVKYSIRHSGGAQGTIINSTFESISASLTNDNKWVLPFDTIQLPDGYYVLYVNASDNLGNVGYTTVNFSIRNWAVLQMLPNTPSSKAGRTMPIKFSLRVAAAVDPTQPFVWDEELTIKIYVKGYPQTVLQTSIYGSGSKDYRISSTEEHYITNFKTLSTPKTYKVDIWRNTLLIGSFEFATVK